MSLPLSIAHGGTPVSSRIPSPASREEFAAEMRLTRLAIAYKEDPASDPCSYVETKWVTNWGGGYTPSAEYLKCVERADASPAGRLRAVAAKIDIPAWAWAIVGAAAVLLLVRR